MTDTSSLHTSVRQALSMGPPPDGNLAIPVLRHGSMEVEYYSPDGIDTQTPHTQDEIYVVVKGSGEFFNGTDTIQVSEGSLLFVPAGVEHRFLNFTEGFAVWVVFYGPEGGESNA